MLGIQTAEYPNDLALLDEKGNLIRRKVLKIKEKTVELLGELFDQVMKDRNVSELTAVGVCLGPGSYTGLRAGLAFGKAVCQFQNIPLVGVSAFEALRAQDAKINEAKILFDAKNERVFFQEGEEILVDSLSKVLAEMQGKLRFAGSGALEYKQHILKELGNKVKFLEEKLSALGVAKAALAKFRENDSIYTKDYLYKVKPLYILPPNITKSVKFKSQN